LFDKDGEKQTTTSQRQQHR